MKADTANFRSHCALTPSSSSSSSSSDAVGVNRDASGAHHHVACEETAHNERERRQNRNKWIKKRANNPETEADFTEQRLFNVRKYI